MKKRVLFVDDEPNVLNGLRRSLHGMREVWDLQFVDSAVRCTPEVPPGTEAAGK